MDAKYSPGIMTHIEDTVDKQNKMVPAFIELTR